MKKSDVLQFFGSASAAAEALGITVSAVCQWGEIIPRGAAYTAQVVTNGGLRVDPAVYPPKKYKNQRLTA